ncbi:DnaJ-domain-containing protein [Polychaeton citri CBS 116435]|uniref:DnaJ-domain-containing protein n=1 Tax=Polychaeton citri CBS 116435 TaxID=1314669 RepID=A0A9P4QGH1_9PEZI|nr:DnaJ-domain-containing protein [Polychaeton citri CBS 116435]
MSRSVEGDYYSILELSHTASLEEITRGFRRLALICHPDKNPGKPSATACFQRVRSRVLLKLVEDLYPS